MDCGFGDFVGGKQETEIYPPLRNSTIFTIMNVYLFILRFGFQMTFTCHFYHSIKKIMNLTEFWNKLMYDKKCST
jgi:hypothetical protein